MFRKFIGEKYFCGLDIGSQTIKAGMIEPKENRHFELQGVYEVRASGFEGNAVTDLGDLTAAIHEVLKGLFKNTGVRTKTVQLGIGGEIVRKRLSSSVMPLLDRGTKVISKKDIDRIQEQARLLGVKMDEVVLHDFPQMYTVDDVNQTVNPAGLYGRKIEAETLVAVVNGTVLKNLVKAVNQAGFEVDNVFFTTYAAAHTALDEFQRQQGCIFLDIGSSVTDVAVFKSGRIRFLDSIPLGGDDVTRAIVSALNIPMDMAEDIKKSYAVARHQDVKIDEEILLKTENGYVPIKKHQITESIEPMISDMLHMIRASCKHFDPLSQLAAGMIIGGGGSLLSGLGERFEEDFKIPVKIAEIQFVSRRMHNAAKFLSAVGLARAGFDKNYGLMTKHQHNAHWLKGCVERVKEIYEEYF